MNTWKPVISRKYRTGGIVQDRIDSGAGPNAKNTMGYNKSSSSTSDFGSMKRKAGTAAAIAAQQAIAANPDAVSDIGGSGVSFDDLASKIGVAGATRALQREPDSEQVGLEPEPEPTPTETTPVEGLTETGVTDNAIANLANVGGVAALIAPTDIGVRSQASKLKPLGGSMFGDPLAQNSLTTLRQGGTIDYRKGGPVAGGPPGRDTVPVVSQPDGPVEAMIDNEEYVLPRKTVKTIGKPNLDQLVVATTGEKPVGYGAGGFFDQFRNRGKQIDAAVDAAVRGSQGGDTVVDTTSPQPEPKPSTSMRDIMREIRKKNPPTQQRVRGYAGGGEYESPSYLEELAKRSRKVAGDIWHAPSVGAGLGTIGRAVGQGYNELGKIGASYLSNVADDAVAVGRDAAAGFAGKTPPSTLLPTPASDPTPASAPTPTQAEILAEQEGLSDATAIKAPVAPVAQESFIRRAGPQDESPITDEAVRAEMAANPGKYQGNALGIDGPTMARANLYSRGPGRNAFSAANVAQARADAQAFETSKTAQQARTVDDINADTEALRDLRRVKTNLADGRPADYRKPQAEPAAQPKLSDMLGVANFQRGVANDQRRAAQDRFSNRLAGNREQRQQVEAANAVQDRFMEQAEQLMPEVAEKMPWLGQGAGSFLRRASESGIENARQALSLLAGSYEGLVEDDGLLFEAESANGQKIPLTGKQAMSILKGEEPLGSSRWWGKMTDEAYEQLRDQAMEKLQSVALEPLAK